MNVAYRLLQKLLPSPADRSIIQQEIRRNNLQRIIYFVVIGVPLHAILIGLFYIKLYDGTELEYKWRLSIILIHLSLLVSYLVIGGAILYIRRTSKYHGFLPSFLITFICLFVPLAGAALATADQLITTSITPFLITCVIISVAFLIPPLLSAVCFTAAYLVYYFLLPLTQTNPDVLTSNQVNGLSAVAVGFGLATIIWQNNMIRFRQARLIESQKQALEANYSQLLQSSEELSQVNATKDKFFSILAHDLRGPITSTLSVSELLLQNKIGPSEERRNQALKMMFNSLSNTSKLLENLLLWSRNQTEAISFSPESFSLKGLIQESTALYFSIASGKEIQLEIRVPDTLHVLADKEMLKIVFRNLVSNAIKFTKPGGIVKITAQPQSLPEDNTAPYIQVEVRDNGLGITPAKAESLFQIGTKVTTLGTNRETGTGLGLILCKEFVERNGGTIRVESEVGQGSVFIFTIPASPEISL